MKRALWCILLAGVLFPGCGSPFQGMKFRAQAPPIEEAFRKLSLAVTVDGYEIDQIMPSVFKIETKWRGAKEQEMSRGEAAVLDSVVECRVSIRLEPRGRMYDVLFTPELRRTSREGKVTEELAGRGHPLTEKWEAVFRQILEREQREED
ncbi:MAG: hypothetical protein IT282_13550 [Bacteroidetes bacterium]|nr:hypothetical protein [Bacteroidota bacterium]